MISPTYGEVSLDEIVRIIQKRVESADGEYDLMIGTDSQNFDKTKVVVVIALHQIGHGGIFFYEITNVRRINNIGQKLLYETELSLNCAKSLVEAFEKLKNETGFDFQKKMSICIHVDAGENGPSKQAIPAVIGWITACGYKFHIKPDSCAASSIANKYSK